MEAGWLNEVSLIRWLASYKARCIDIVAVYLLSSTRFPESLFYRLKISHYFCLNFCHLKSHQANVPELHNFLGLDQRVEQVDQAIVSLKC